MSHVILDLWNTVVNSNLFPSVKSVEKELNRDFETNKLVCSGYDQAHFTALRLISSSIPDLKFAPGRTITAVVFNVKYTLNKTLIIYGQAG